MKTTQRPSLVCAPGDDLDAVANHYATPGLSFKDRLRTTEERTLLRTLARAKRDAIKRSKKGGA